MHILIWSQEEDEGFKLQPSNFLGTVSESSKDYDSKLLQYFIWISCISVHERNPM